MISAAQFTQWIQDQASKVTVLAELAFAYQQTSAIPPPAPGAGAGYLSVPAAEANVPATLPDSANNSITGDMTLIWDVNPADYATTTGGAQSLGWKDDRTGAQKSWQAIILDTGTPRLSWSANGAAYAFVIPGTATLTSAGFNAGTRFLFAMELRVNDGAGNNTVKFWASSNSGSTWTQIGATVVTAGVTSVFDSTSPIWIGDPGTIFPSHGGHKFYQFWMYTGLFVTTPGGATRKQYVDFTNAANGATTVADTDSGTWAIGADSTVVNSSGGGGTGYSAVEAKIYLADRPFVTGPADSPPNTSYRDVIDAAPEFTRSIDLNALGGRGTSSLGSLSLNNADGSLDFLLDTIIDGRDIRFYLGDASWARTDFRLVAAGVVSTVKADSDIRITLTLRDKNLLLDAVIAGSQIPSGPNAGRLIPFLIGQVYNFDLSPYLIDATGPTYAFHGAAVADYTMVLDVRDSGVSLNKGSKSGDNTAFTANATTDLISYTGHGLAADDVVAFAGNVFAGLTAGVQYWVLASGLTANDFKLSLTRGGAAVDITGTTFAGSLIMYDRRWYVNASVAIGGAFFATITLSSSPSGRATADILANGTSGYAASTQVPHTAFRYILDTFTKLTITDRDEASFTALSTAELTGAQVLWGIAVLDRMNVMDALDQICIITSSWYAWRADGLLTVGKLDLPNLDGATAIDTITADDMLGDPSVENLALQFGKIVMNTVPNVVTQTDGLASSVSAATRSLYANKYQYQLKTTDPGGGTYLAQWWLYHKTAIDSQPLGTYFSQATTVKAQPVVDERTALFRPWTRVFRVPVGLHKYGQNPGDCVIGTYPRYGMSAGKKFRVISVKVRPSERMCDLVLARQTLPNYLATSYA